MPTFEGKLGDCSDGLLIFRTPDVCSVGTIKQRGRTISVETEGSMTAAELSRLVRDACKVTIEFRELSEPAQLTTGISPQDTRSMDEIVTALALQGYAASGKAGEPHTVTLGVPRDGESPERFLRGLRDAGLTPNCSIADVRTAMARERVRSLELANKLQRGEC